jgi:hypothetical protein
MPITWNVEHKITTFWWFPTFISMSHFKVIIQSTYINLETSNNHILECNARNKSISPAGYGHFSVRNDPDPKRSRSVTRSTRWLVCDNIYGTNDLLSPIYMQLSHTSWWSVDGTRDSNCDCIWCPNGTGLHAEGQVTKETRACHHYLKNWRIAKGVTTICLYTMLFARGPSFVS